MNSEEQYLFMLLTAVLNQTPIRSIRKQLDWEELLKISDFHNVLNVVYYGILGVQKDASEEWAEKLFQKYKKEVLLTQEYKSAEEAIEWQLSRYGIHALILKGTAMYRYYLKQEMGYIRSLEIMVDKGDLPYVHSLMQEMDYEEKENRMDDGVLYTRTPGIKVVFYDKIPLGTKGLQKQFHASVKRYKHKRKKRYIHYLTVEEQYLYLNGRLVEQYIRGELKIRDIMEIWQYRKKNTENFQKEKIRDQLEKAGLLKFAGQIDVLARMWFDGENQNTEDCGVALELEEYILSQGKENRWLDGTILPHERARLDFYRRDREEEWSKKRREWRFPPRDYMTQLFPVLEKYPFLLAFFWLVREYRFYKTRYQRRREEAVLKLKIKWLAVKSRFSKKEEPEIEADAETETEADTETEMETDVEAETDGESAEE